MLFNAPFMFFCVVGMCHDVYVCIDVLLHHVPRYVYNYQRV